MVAAAVDLAQKQNGCRINSKQNIGTLLFDATEEEDEFTKIDST
jgi:hypothetical protein